MITDGLAFVNEQLSNDEIYQEVESHAKFAASKSKLYCCKLKFLTKVYEKLSNPENNRPFVMYGESGVGKTATTAKIIVEASKAMTADKEQDVAVVYRWVTIGHETCAQLGSKSEGGRWFFLPLSASINTFTRLLQIWN